MLNIQLTECVKSILITFTLSNLVRDHITAFIDWRETDQVAKEAGVPQALLRFSGFGLAGQTLIVGVVPLCLATFIVRIWPETFREIVWLGRHGGAGRGEANIADSD